MTLKGLWVRGFCTVGIAVLTAYEAAFSSYSDAWGFKEWNHAAAVIIIAFLIGLRGFKDQSATDYKNTAGTCDTDTDTTERVPTAKRRA